MAKARMLGQFKPYTPNSRNHGRNRKAPWQGKPMDKAPAAATKKQEVKK